MPLSPPPPPLRFTSRPALVIGVSVAVGIVAARLVSGVGPMLWATVSAGTLVAVTVHRMRTRGRLVTLRPAALAASVVIVSVAVGGLRHATWKSVRKDDVSALADHPASTTANVVLEGTLLDVPTRTDWSIRFVLEADTAEQRGRRAQVSGRVQIALHHNDGTAVYPALEEGDRVRLEGQIGPRPRRRNPAQMDYGAYLERQGIGAVFRVEDETGIAFLAPSRRLDHRLATRVRRHVRRTLGRTVLEAEPRALLLALILADRSDLEDATLDAFRATGLMHLLAVSGLHIGLVGLVLYGLLKPVLGRLGVPRRRLEVTRASVTLALLAVYVLISGASVSVVRAFVMVSALVVGHAAERRVDTLNALGLAAAILLIHRPAALFEVGFQLSFGAVFAIVTLAPLLTSKMPARVRASSMGTAIAGSVATTIAATIGTAPALLAHFGRLPIGGLILNLPAIPLTAVTLGAGLGSVVMAPFDLASRAFGAVANLAGAALLRGTAVGSQALGGLAYRAFLDDPFVLAAIASAILAAAMWRRPIARRRVLIVVGACIAISVWQSVLEGDAVPDLEVVFLDVGQGDATLVETPNGRHVLVDAGVRSPYTDQGERTVVPYLERFGITHLDALVLTHSDADHIGGARAVLEGVEVGRLVVNGRAGESDLWRALIATADSLAVPVQAVAAGDTLEVDPAVRFRVLGPSPGAASRSANDASVVLHLEHESVDWLLTGDAEAEGERDLTSAYAPLLRADVVKVGHHGSETSSTAALVGAVGRPAYAVVSVAERNRYGLPDEGPLERWAATGAEVLLTSIEGAVWLRSDGKTVERVDWRK